MSNAFLNEKSVDRKKVIQSLTDNLTHLNISVAYDGLQKHSEHLVCGTKASDGTLHSIFSITIDMACLDGPPVLNITQLENIVRRELFTKKNLVLSIDVYKVYIVGALTNVSIKTTAKMRLIVTPPEDSLMFYPGTTADPDPEKRLIYLFFGKPIDGLADMANKAGGAKMQYDEIIYSTCNSLQCQNSINFSDSKSDLHDFLTNFSFKTVESMKALLKLAADVLVGEGSLDTVPGT